MKTETSKGFMWNENGGSEKNSATQKKSKEACHVSNNRNFSFKSCPCDTKDEHKKFRAQIT